MSLVPDKMPEDSQDNQSENTSGETTERPEWLPEKYFNPDSGEAKIQDLAVALAETQTALRNKKEEMRGEIEAELKAGRPESPDSYLVEEVKVGDQDVAFKFGDNDPLLSKVRKWAHEQGVSQDAFSELTKAYAEAQVAQQPNIAEEFGKLGENAQKRIDALVGHAKAVATSDDDWQVFSEMSKTAAHVEFMEKLVAGAKPKSPQDFDSSGDHVDSMQAEYDRLKSSEEYWKQDIGTINRVNQLQEKLTRSKKRA